MEEESGGVKENTFRSSKANSAIVTRRTLDTLSWGRTISPCWAQLLLKLLEINNKIGEERR